MLRDRGRLVVVGKTKVDLPWEYAFGKEIEVRFSRSYGPGRYDPAYEWAGADYPIGYVRWTEQRNFDACLQLMRTGELDLARVTTRRAPFTQALEIYQQLMGPGGASEAGVVLEYASPARSAAPKLSLMQRPREQRRPAPPSRPERRRRRQSPFRRASWTTPSPAWMSSAPATSPAPCCCRT